MYCFRRRLKYECDTKTNTMKTPFTYDNVADWGSRFDQIVNEYLEHFCLFIHRVLHLREINVYALPVMPDAGFLKPHADKNSRSGIVVKKNNW